MRTTKLVLRVGLGLAITILMMTGVASANSYTFNTPSGSLTSGGVVSASATITTSTNYIDITLMNLIADPHAQAQIITGLYFGLTGGKFIGTGTAPVSSSAYARDLAPDGTYTESYVSPTNWTITNVNKTNIGLCAGGCSTLKPEGVIGDPAANGLYVQANPSITGTQHSPEIYGGAAEPSKDPHFRIYSAGVTSNTAISSLNFVFGTSNEQITGTPGPPPPPPGPVPEPASIFLFGSGAALFVGRFRKSLKTR